MSAPVLHVNAPASFPGRRHLNCVTCRTVTRFAVREYGWYAPLLTCCNCGDSWSDGWRHQRPFRRDWRKNAIARAEQTWAEASQYTAEDRQAWLEAEWRQWSWLVSAGPEAPETLVEQKS